MEDIAQAYEGKETQLISYLKGETESIVNPAKGEAMKRYVQKTKAFGKTLASSSMIDQVAAHLGRRLYNERGDSYEASKNYNA